MRFASPARAVLLGFYANASLARGRAPPVTSSTRSSQRFRPTDGCPASPARLPPPSSTNREHGIDGACRGRHVHAPCEPSVTPPSLFGSLSPSLLAFNPEPFTWPSPRTVDCHVTPCICTSQSRQVSTRNGCQSLIHYYITGLCSRPFVPAAFGPGTIGGFCPGSNG